MWPITRSMPIRSVRPRSSTRNSTLPPNAASVAFAEPVQTWVRSPTSATNSFACSPRSSMPGRSAVASVVARIEPPLSASLSASGMTGVGVAAQDECLAHRRERRADPRASSDSGRETSTSVSAPAAGEALRHPCVRNGETTSIRSTFVGNGQDASRPGRVARAGRQSKSAGSSNRTAAELVREGLDVARQRVGDRLARHRRERAHEPREGLVGVPTPAPGRAVEAEDRVPGAVEREVPAEHKQPIATLPPLGFAISDDPHLGVEDRAGRSAARPRGSSPRDRSGSAGSSTAARWRRPGRRCRSAPRCAGPPRGVRPGRWSSARRCLPVEEREADGCGEQCRQIERVRRADRAVQRESGRRSERVEEQLAAFRLKHRCPRRAVASRAGYPTGSVARSPSGSRAGRCSMLHPSSPAGAGGRGVPGRRFSDRSRSWMSRARRAIRPPDRGDGRSAMSSHCSTKRRVRSGMRRARRAMTSQTPVRSQCGAGVTSCAVISSRPLRQHLAVAAPAVARVPSSRRPPTRPQASRCREGRRRG